MRLSVVGETESLPQQPQNRFRGDRHLGDGTETGAHVFQAGPEEMDLVVDDEEAVVVFMRQLDELDFGVLGVVLLQVGEELLVVAGVDGGRDTFFALGEHREHTVVHEIVDEDDSAFGTPDQVGDIRPRVPYAARGEDLFGELLGRVLFHLVENGINFLVGLNLMSLQMGDSHQNICILNKKLSHRDKSIDDSDAGIDGSFAGKDRWEHRHAIDCKSIRESGGIFQCFEPVAICDQFLQLIFSQLKSVPVWESSNISSHLLIQLLCCNVIDHGQVPIYQNLCSTNR